ncbi:hypothetical protein V6N12_028184 [Hibiscus sabdariffa]|uniref:Uncharacterized protein n=1 Tax=Hibiscus sabdariffa TaxID=183260 RepID=A0ABR2F531_9ROSI
MLAAAATTAGPPLHHTSYTLQYMDKFSRHREVETWQTPPVPLRTDNIVNPPGTLASIRRDDNPKYRFGKIAGVSVAFESSHSPKLDCGFMCSQSSGCTRQSLSRPIHMRSDFWHCRYDHEQALTLESEMALPTGSGEADPELFGMLPYWTLWTICNYNILEALPFNSR